MPDTTSKFVSIRDVKDTIAKFLKRDVVQEVGYISPGHGAKGCHNSLLKDSDLVAMYEEYEGRRGVNGVLLWCYAADDETVAPRIPRKRSKSPDKNDDAPPSKCGKNLKQIEEIVDKLKQKHAKRYTIEQYNCWAHTLDMGKHDSYDQPPDLPFFVGRKKPTTSHSVVPNESDHPQSPGKRIRYRSECMDQLNKWHTLMEKQIITQEQYQGFIGTILQDIENL